MEQRGSRDRHEAIALLSYLLVAAVLLVVPVLLQAGTMCFQGEPDQPRLCSDAGLTVATLWLGVTAVALTVGLAWLMLALRHGRRGAATAWAAARGPAILPGVLALAHVVIGIALG